MSVWLAGVEDQTAMRDPTYMAEIRLLAARGERHGVATKPYDPSWRFVNMFAAADGELGATYSNIRMILDSGQHHGQMMPPS